MNVRLLLRNDSSLALKRRAAGTSTWEKRPEPGRTPCKFCNPLLSICSFQGFAAQLHQNSLPEEKSGSAKAEEEQEGLDGGEGRNSLITCRR